MELSSLLCVCVRAVADSQNNHCAFWAAWDSTELAEASCEGSTGAGAWGGLFILCCCVCVAVYTPVNVGDNTGLSLST